MGRKRSKWIVEFNELYNQCIIEVLKGEARQFHIYSPKEIEDSETNKKALNKGGDIYETIIKFSKNIDFRYNSKPGGSMVLTKWFNASEG